MCLFVSSVSSLFRGKRRFGTEITSCPVPPQVVGLSGEELGPALSTFDSHVSDGVNSAGPAVAVSVVYNQDVVFSKGYGLINVSGKFRHVASQTDRWVGESTIYGTSTWKFEPEVYVVDG